MVAIRVPAELGTLLNGVEVPGTPTQAAEYHLTILHLGSPTIEELSKLVVATYEVASRTRPIYIRLDRMTAFPSGPDGFPIVCLATSPELHALHEDLKKAYDAAEVSYSKKFPVYRPHMTLSYAEKDLEEMPFGPIDFTAFDFLVYGGSEGDEKLTMRFPFTMPGKTALYRHLIRLATTVQLHV